MFNIVKVPFQNKINARRKVKGVAYYFFNEDWTECHYQMPYLISGQYRPNDDAMMKGKNGQGTRCWQTISAFRKTLFTYQEKNFLTKNLTSEQIQKINEHIWKGNITTVLNLDKWLSGSNPTGAEKNFSATPFLTRFTWDNFLNFLVFANLFNNIKTNPKNFLEKIHINFDDFINFDDQVISLQIFLEKKCDLKFLRLFYQYNRGLLVYETLSSRLKSRLDLNEVDERYLEKVLQQKTPKLEAELNSSLAKRDHFLNIIKSWTLIDEKNQRSIKNRLRFFFTDTFKLKKQILKLADASFVEGDVFENVSALEIAHIFPVNRAWLKKDYKAIADYNNGIWISANLHTLFDKNRYYIKIIDKQVYFYSQDKTKKLFINQKWIVENKFAILEYIEKYLNIFEIKTKNKL